VLNNLELFITRFVVSFLLFYTYFSFHLIFKTRRKSGLFFCPDAAATASFVQSGEGECYFLVNVT